MASHDKKTELERKPKKESCNYLHRSVVFFPLLIGMVVAYGYLLHLAGKRGLENLKSKWNKVHGSCISSITLAIANSVPHCFFEILSDGQSELFRHLWHIFLLGS